jgi:hypothetical protein
MSSLLLERMDALRQQAKQDDPSPRSADSSRSTLATFLLLYSKASHDCYIDYNQGTKDLLSWLTSNGTAPLDWEAEKYPEIENTRFKVPRLSCGYESSEVAKILASSRASYPNSDLYLAAVARAERAIYFTMTKQVVYELY